jgi:hypothetical protein
MMCHYVETILNGLESFEMPPGVYMVFPARPKTNWAEVLPMGMPNTMPTKSGCPDPGMNMNRLVPSMILNIMMRAVNE